MSTRMRFTLLTMITVVAAAVVLVAGAGSGAGRPGATLQAKGKLVSADKTVIGTFTLMAEESEEPGRGDMAFHLEGRNISACDAHGPGATPGSTPLAEVECFGTGNVSVAIDGCTAVLETHGIVHADHPHTVFLGPVTLDLEFERHTSSRGQLRIDIHTPKDAIVLQGATAGPIAMSTCG
ncbi:MAG: hypothetical protein ACRDI0_12785 [Actinomycetota bacterium]